MRPDVRPPRPHTSFTEDGKRLAEVTTYVRRGTRLGSAQRAAWERRRGDWLIPDEAVDDPDLDLAAWFGRRAPLIVEIGSGNGEATAALAAARPGFDVLAFEVWRPGVAQTFLRLEGLGVQNVRVVGVDAVWCLEHVLGPQSIAELWTFFPDPWPKKKHQRRRMVTSRFAAVAASRLVRGGLWRLATDWPGYAAQMVDVLAGEPLLEDVDGGLSPRWVDRPPTHFERRGQRAGRPITDLTFRRV